MTPLLLFGAICVIGAIPALWWAVTGTRADQARGNLTAGLTMPTLREQQLAHSPIDRLLGPLARKFADLARRLTPAARCETLNDRLVRAGNPMGMDLRSALSAKTLAGGSLLSLGLLRFVGSPSVGGLVFAVLLGAGGFYLPDLLLGIARDRRADEIRASAADIIDQLTIIVEAGLGLEAAMARVATSNEGPLATEFSRTLQDIRAGVPRSRALGELAVRVDIPEMRQLVSAIHQAEKHGVPIATTLRIQAGEIRLKRQQFAEEKAMKLQV